MLEENKCKSIRRTLYGIFRIFMLQPELEDSYWMASDLGTQMLMVFYHRADDKTAAFYNLEGGSTLHLVLALRGGC